MFATVLALLTSNGDSAKVQRGCGVASDMWDGQKYFNEDNRDTSPLSLISHHEIILDLHRLFQDCLVGGDHWGWAIKGDKVSIMHQVQETKEPIVPLITGLQ